MSISLFASNFDDSSVHVCTYSLESLYEHHSVLMSDLPFPKR